MSTFYVKIGIDRFEKAARALEIALLEFNTFIQGGDPEQGNNLDRTALYLVLQDFLEQRKNGNLKSADLPEAKELEDLFSQQVGTSAYRSRDEIEEKFLIQENLTEKLISALDAPSMMEDFNALPISSEDRTDKVDVLRRATKLLLATKRGVDYLATQYNQSSVSIFNRKTLEKDLGQIHLEKIFDSEKNEVVEVVKSVGQCIKIFREFFVGVILPLEGFVLRSKFPSLDVTEKTDLLMRHFDKLLVSIKSSKIEAAPAQKAVLIEGFEEIRYSLRIGIEGKLQSFSNLDYDSYREMLGKFINYGIWESPFRKIDNIMEGAPPFGDLDLQKMELTRSNLAALTDAITHFTPVVLAGLQFSNFLKGDKTVKDTLQFSMDVAEAAALLYDTHQKYTKGVSFNAMHKISPFMVPASILLSLSDAADAVRDENYPLMTGHLANASSTAIFAYYAFAATSTASVIGMGIGGIIAAAGLYSVMKFTKSKVSTNLLKFFKYCYFGEAWEQVNVISPDFSVSPLKDDGFFFGWRTQVEPGRLSPFGYPDYEDLRHKRSLVSKFYSILYPINITDFKRLRHPNLGFQIKIEPAYAPLMGAGFQLFIQPHFRESYHGPIPGEHSVNGRWKFSKNPGEDGDQRPGLPVDTSEYYYQEKVASPQFDLDAGNSKIPTFKSIEFYVLRDQVEEPHEDGIPFDPGELIAMEIGLIISADNMPSTGNGPALSALYQGRKPNVVLREIIRWTHD